MSPIHPYADHHFIASARMQSFLHSLPGVLAVNSCGQHGMMLQKWTRRIKETYILSTSVFHLLFGLHCPAYPADSLQNAVPVINPSWLSLLVCPGFEEIT